MPDGLLRCGDPIFMRTTEVEIIFDIQQRTPRVQRLYRFREGIVESIVHRAFGRFGVQRRPFGIMAQRMVGKSTGKDLDLTSVAPPGICTSFRSHATRQRAWNGSVVTSVSVARSASNHSSPHKSINNGSLNWCTTRVLAAIAASDVQ